MPNTYNIAGTGGSVMVPVLTETGSLMAYVLYPDTTGTLQELYSCMSIPRQFPYSVQAIPRQINTHTGTTRCGTLYYKNAIGCTGQPIIQQSKRKTMSKSSSTGATGGASADRIKNDAAFERTRENMAEFSRAGKAAKLLRTIFRDVTINAKDKVTQARLLKVASRIITTDAVNERGARVVNNGDMAQLQGFNFNVRAGISDSLFVRCPLTFTRASGEVTEAEKEETTTTSSIIY